MSGSTLTFSFANRHVLVAGEVGIDEYLWGSCRRISPEAPVPVVEVERESVRLGMAGNVAQNVAALGAHATVVSAFGDDSDGRLARQLLTEAGVADVRAVIDSSRPTPRKTRVIAQRQHVVRVDREKSVALDARLAGEYRELVEERLSSVDAVIVEDYGKGLWRSDTLAFVERARALGKPVFVDPCKSAPLASYRGVTLLTPNLQEAAALAGMPGERVDATDDVAMESLARKIVDGAESEHAIVTCGEHGMVAVSRGGKGLLRMPTFAREVFDVTGAGDTVIAVLALAYVAGHPLAQAMALANAAAGIVVGRLGTASIGPDELQAELDRLARERSLPLGH